MWKSFRLEKTLRSIPVISLRLLSPPLNHVRKHPHPHVWNASRDGDSTTSLGSLFRCLTTVLIKKFFLIPSLNLCLHNLRPFLSSYQFSLERRDWQPSCYNLLWGSCRVREGLPSASFFSRQNNTRSWKRQSIMGLPQWSSEMVAKMARVPWNFSFWWCALATFYNV